jgi:hypothetical protein
MKTICRYLVIGVSNLKYHIFAIQKVLHRVIIYPLLDKFNFLGTVQYKNLSFSFDRSIVIVVNHDITNWLKCIPRKPFVKWAGN